MAFTFHYEKPVAATLNSSIVLLSKSSKGRKGGIMTTYCAMVSYLPENYTSDDFIAEMDVEVLHFTILFKVTSTE